MTRQAITGRVASAAEIQYVAGSEDVAGHPVWCRQGFHCTAYTAPAGEHTSIPEIWETSFGRVVTTRHRGQDWVNRMELRVVLRLDPRELVAKAMCRHLVATTCAVIAQVFGNHLSKMS